MPLLPVGAVFLLVSLGAAGILAWSHFSGLSAPGCGVGSACDKAARSLWSLSGVAYFAALLAGWLVGRGRVDANFKWIVRGGVLISLFLVGSMLATSLWCQYCLAVHAGNLAFWLVVEKSPTIAATNRRLVAITVSAFALGAAALGLAETLTRQSVSEQRAVELAQTTQQIIEKTSAAAANNAVAGDAPAAYSPEGGFTGRYLLGPPNAPIRLVIISDYQCKDCFDIEQQMHALLARRDDISLSAKHYPFCTDCNKYLGQANMHKNACWAARAAEAAGILAGNEGFWKMHRWLFYRGGSFTDAELTAALPALGFDPATFLPTMQSQRTLDLVQADIEEATALGLHFTPMIFINGVELRGFINNPTALSRAVDALAATNPQPGSPDQDQPALAVEKTIGDWRFQPVLSMPDHPPTWPLGPDDAKVKVVVWTDVQFAMSAELDQVIRQQMASHGDIQYTFRTYPMDNACNPYTKVARVSPACWAAAAGEAAGLLGGGEAYWKMHDWLLSHQKELNDAALRAAAPELGLDADALIEMMNSDQVKGILMQQCESASSRIRKGIPTVYVNGKWVARWKIEGKVVLPDILDQARRH
ncbi:MAG: thioredoxin domain-containing protein [Phycisphaerales bacterium]|nr:thioredoxin domain-containing protein [Phycisphaerales bacterium]MCI0675752.1 thioredoxin domain-containing protein [Phycisphaerales bacterium]